MGEINAILESGMSMSEVLVYFKLHKFQLEAVKKVKMLHKIQFPGRPCIKLDEAIKLMNEVTADEVELTKDSVAIEQTMQGLTMTAIPTASQAATPAVTPKTQPQSTPKKQNEGKKNNKNKKKKWTPNYYTPSYCHFCEGEDDYTGHCPKFTTPQQKRSELARLNKCQECVIYIKKGTTHNCNMQYLCRHCGGRHRPWLCLGAAQLSK